MRNETNSPFPESYVSEIDRIELLMLGGDVLSGCVLGVAVSILAASVGAGGDFTTTSAVVDEEDDRALVFPPSNRSRRDPRRGDELDGCAADVVGVMILPGERRRAVTKADDAVADVDD